MNPNWLARWTRQTRCSIVALLMLGFLSACGGGDPPGMPTGLAAIGGDANVTLSWAATSGADSYTLYWSASPGITAATGTKFTGINTPGYVHTSLANGSEYYYRVMAVNGDGESPLSAEVSVTLVPSAPTTLTAAGGDSQATLTWPASAGATSYNLYWGTSAGVAKTTGTKIEGVTSPYVHTGLTNGLAYYYIVTAVNAGGEGAASSEATVTLAPAAPSLVSVVSGDTFVTVDWLEVVGATSYNLYVSTTPDVTTTTATEIENVTPPYKHTGLTNGTEYYYVVTAIGAGGESLVSEQVSTTPEVPVPGAPTNVIAVLTPETTKSVTIQWSPPLPPPDPEFVLSYNLYRGTTPGIANDMASATKTEGVVSPHIDTVPVGQVTYYYVLTAVTAGGEGPPSAEVSATPRGSPGTGGGGSGQGPGGDGHETTFGNNLSVPVVFADGMGLTGAEITGTDHTDLATGLRPTATDITDPFPYFDPATIYLLGGTSYYKQKTASTWQASWINGTNQMQKVELDWGDSLTSAALSSSQVIRVETILRQYKGSAAWPSTESMTGYPMQLLYGAGITEMQGTTGVAMDATERRVFAVTARLSIRKLEAGAPQDHICGFEGSIAEALALPDGSQLAKYTAEINVGGSQTYGFNWRLGQCTAPDKAGTWRITFSLDEQVDVGGKSLNNNVQIDTLHPSETTAVIDNQRTSHIDITVK
jgi:fibronectin type 3 domain-containing protein